MKRAYNMPHTNILPEINISQTQVKRLEATESIFHRQGVIKSLNPAPPVFEAARGPAASSRMARCHLKLQPSGFGPLHKFNRYGKEFTLRRVEKFAARGAIYPPTVAPVALERPRGEAEAAMIKVSARRAVSLHHQRGHSSCQGSGLIYPRRDQ